MRPTSGWKATQYLYREKICSFLQTHYLESPDIRRPHVPTGIKCWLPAEIYIQCLSEYDSLLQTAHKLGSFSSLSLLNKFPSDWHYFFKHVYFSRVSVTSYSAHNSFWLCKSSALIHHWSLQETLRRPTYFKLHLFQVTTDTNGSSYKSNKGLSNTNPPVLHHKSLN